VKALAVISGSFAMIGMQAVYFLRQMKIVAVRYRWLVALRNAMAEAFEGRVRFGGFELDLHSGELCPIEAGENRQKVLLREQPFQVLRMLIASEGKIVTREAMRKQLWPNDTIVDFDHSINVAIRILRREMGDSADNPKYIETLARRGYRLRTPVEWFPAAVEAIRPGVAVPRSSLGLASCRDQPR
jgi:DNA-binding winged helix-turn-helix (wHTH) protein